MRAEAWSGPHLALGAGPSAGEEPRFGAAGPTVPYSPQRLAECLCGAARRAGKRSQGRACSARLCPGGRPPRPGPHRTGETGGGGVRSSVTRLGRMNPRTPAVYSRRHPFSPQRYRPNRSTPVAQTRAHLQHSSPQQMQIRVHQILHAVECPSLGSVLGGTVRSNERSAHPPWSSQSGKRDPQQIGNLHM